MRPQEVIAHLNDDHRWAREKIGAWVAGIEPADAQPPADVPKPAWQDDKLAHSSVRADRFPPSILVVADQGIE